MPIHPDDCEKEIINFDVEYEGTKVTFGDDGERAFSYIVKKLLLTLRKMDPTHSHNLFRT